MRLPCSGCRRKVCRQRPGEVQEGWARVPTPSPETQEGAGDDILAGNWLALVGLYRDVYDIQPRWNSSCLEPRLTPELNGTRLNYRLRQKRYEVKLGTDANRMGAENFRVEVMRQRIGDKANEG